MNEVKLEVNAAVVASHRRALSNIGKTFGGQFWRASEEDTNIRQAQDVLESESNNNLDLVLNRSPRRFKANGTDIVAVEIGEDAQGASMVFINRGRKKVVGDKEFSQEAIIPVSSEMRIDADASSDVILKQALEGDRTKLFADPNSIVEKLNILNDNEITRIDALIGRLKKWREMIVNTKNSNIEKARRYTQERTATPVDLSVSVSED
jgi:hypothetical protein